jgi:hypothetical protein
VCRQLICLLSAGDFGSLINFLLDDSIAAAGKLVWQATGVTRQLVTPASLQQTHVLSLTVKLAGKRRVMELEIQTGNKGTNETTNPNPEP